MVRRVVFGLVFLVAGVAAFLGRMLYGTGDGGASGRAVAQAAVTEGTEGLIRFGVFARPQGPPPFGVFSRGSKARSPHPYPVYAGDVKAYCNATDPSGVSIVSGSPLDPAKMRNIYDLEVTWTRGGPAPFLTDLSHITAGRYEWAAFDAMACALHEHHIEVVDAVSPGPVQYNSGAGFSPAARPLYASATDFAGWCTVSAQHMKIFGLHTYTIPGNEVNSDHNLWTGGDEQIASYTQACYAAVKAVDPHAFVYGFELNMDGRKGATDFVKRMYGLGCKVGTCYDGISAHLSLRWPLRPSGTPCYPNPGGDYTIACLADLRTAARGPVEIMIGETVTNWPYATPDASSAALAARDMLKTFSATGYIRYVLWANVDECAAYKGSNFRNGCLIDEDDRKTPSWQPVHEIFQKGNGAVRSHENASPSSN